MKSDVAIDRRGTVKEIEAKMPPVEDMAIVVGVSSGVPVPP